MKSNKEKIIQERSLGVTQNKAHQDQQIKDELAKNHACYVLVTCNGPADDGNMQVEMTYHGDATLAALLLHGAQTYMDEENYSPDLE